LAIKSVTVAKKFFTIACHIQNDGELVEVLTHWLKIGDSSCFAKSHIESAGLHKLQPADCLAVIRDYSRGTIVRYVNIFLRIFLILSKPQIELRIKLINSRYANLETLEKSHPN
jgi:hypothetical protein